MKKILLLGSLVPLLLSLGFACNEAEPGGDSDGEGGEGGQADDGGSSGGRPSSGGGGNPSGGSGTGGSEPEFTEPRGPCDPAKRTGRFSAEAQEDFGVVTGNYADGIVPTSIPAVTLEEGDCKLLKRRNLSCIPACVGAQTCGADGECVPFPRNLDIGSVSIRGLTTAVEMVATQPGNQYFFPDAENPPYEPGKKVFLDASGKGDIPGFKLYGVGSEPITDEPTWVLKEGSPLAVAWEAPQVAAPTTVLVELTIDQHGLSPLTLSCEFEDDGEAEVPASVVDAMISSGVSGFPNGRIFRRSADHLDIGEGCVDFVVGSPLKAKVSVDGFTPCMNDAACPDGQYCDEAVELCKDN